MEAPLLDLINIILRNRKHVPYSYRVYRNTSESLGEREMLRKHEPQVSVSKAFPSSPKLSRLKRENQLFHLTACARSEFLLSFIQ